MTQYRKEPLKNGEIYHIFTRSISKFVIFNDSSEYERFCQLIRLYRHRGFICQYSDFSRYTVQSQNSIIQRLESENDCLVEIIAYCLMPTHIHFILKQVADDGISKFLSRILNSYSRYFNTKHNRVGPLWSGRFKSVLVEDDEQLLHLTRYIHLNPSSAGLIDAPVNWKYSSIEEYISGKSQLCKFGDLIEMNPKEYLKFVLDNKDYQKQLAKIKSLLIDNYSG